MKYPSKWFAIFGALALCSCTTLPVGVSSPSVIAQQTSIDERALLGAEASYMAARSLIEAAVDSGQIQPGQAAKFYRVNGKLNAALVRARRAYDAANAPNFNVALAEASPLVSELWQIVAQQGKLNGR